jgi:hypothetical protein
LPDLPLLFFPLFLFSQCLALSLRFPSLDQFGMLRREDERFTEVQAFLGPAPLQQDRSVLVTKTLDCIMLKATDDPAIFANVALRQEPSLLDPTKHGIGPHPQKQAEIPQRKSVVSKTCLLASIEQI